MNLRPNIYAFNLLKSTGVNFSQDESFTISRILDLSNSLTLNNITIEDIAKKTLKIFAMAELETWSKVDRICFAYRDSLSNQIRILSSAQTPNVKENILHPGYSCLINENSSLLDLKDGSIRIYDNIEQILESFVDSKRKIQRSISLLFQSGLNSGITIPLCVQGRTHGFLFINSSELGAFNKLSAQDYSMLCLLKVVFQTMLSDLLNQLIGPALLNCIAETPNKNQIDSDNLHSDLEKLCKDYFKIEIQFLVKTKIQEDILISYRKFLHSVIICLNNIQNLSTIKSISLDFIEVKDNFISVVLLVEDENQFQLNSQVDSVDEIEDLKVSYMKDRILFTLKAEPKVDGLLYSV
jgi:hypothetical protein